MRVGVGCPSYNEFQRFGMSSRKLRKFMCRFGHCIEHFYRIKTFIHLSSPPARKLVPVCRPQKYYENLDVQIREF